MQYNGDLPKNQSHHKNCVGNAVKTFRAMSELWENQGGDHLCLVAKENVCGSTKESPEQVFSEQVGEVEAKSEEFRAQSIVLNVLILIWFSKCRIPLREVEELDTSVEQGNTDEYSQAGNEG